MAPTPAPHTPIVYVDATDTSLERRLCFVCARWFVLDHAHFAAVPSFPLPPEDAAREVTETLLQRLDPQVAVVRIVHRFPTLREPLTAAHRALAPTTDLVTARACPHPDRWAEWCGAGPRTDVAAAMGVLGWPAWLTEHADTIRLLAAMTYGPPDLLRWTRIPLTDRWMTGIRVVAMA